MGDRLDHLFQEWHSLGGAVLVARAESISPRSPEAVIAESTAHCRESGRLTWVVLDWMIYHIEEIEVQKLVEMTSESGDLSVLGVLCDAAYQKNPHPKFKQLMRACTPHDKVEPFFYRVARSPLASKMTQENALDLFRRWNYLSNELRYLADG